MSTKIYNAYVMERSTSPNADKTQWITLKDIDKNLRSIAKRGLPHILKRVRSLLSEELIRIHDGVVLNAIKFNSYELNSSVYSLACRNLDREQAKARREDAATTMDFSLSATIFTHNDGTPAAVIFFGHNIWLNYIYDNAAKFGLRDYHYQNSTDDRRGATAREWAARKRFWDKMIPTGVPWEAGYNKEVYHPDYSLFSDLAYTAKDWQKERPSFERRLAVHAHHRAAFMYMRDTAPSGDHTKQMFTARVIALTDDVRKEQKPLYLKHVAACKLRYGQVFKAYKQVSFKSLQQPVGDLIPDQGGPAKPEDWVGSLVKVTINDGEVPVHGFVSEYEDSSRGKFLLVKSDRWAGTRAIVPGTDLLAWEGF